MIISHLLVMTDPQLPDFGSDNKPDQALHFQFPKCEFGKTKIVKRAFQVHWFRKWQWLHYDHCRDLAFCRTSITAFKTGKMTLSTGNVKDSAFLYTGFGNWKDSFGSQRRVPHTKQ